MKRCGWKVEYKRAALGTRGSAYSHLTDTLTGLGAQKFKTKKSVHGEGHSTARRAGGTAHVRVVVANGRRIEDSVRRVRPVSARLRAGHYTGAKAEAWCLLIHADASLSPLCSARQVIGQHKQPCHLIGQYKQAYFGQSGDRKQNQRGLNSPHHSILYGYTMTGTRVSAPTSIASSQASAWPAPGATAPPPPAPEPPTVPTVMVRCIVVYWRSDCHVIIMMRWISSSSRRMTRWIRIATSYT